MDGKNEEIKGNIGNFQEQLDEDEATKANTEREKQYKALVDFLKKDVEIKSTLMSLAPKSADEYSENSRIAYLDRLFSEIKDFEFKFNSIARNFNMESQLGDSFKTYFDRIKGEFSELGYSRNNESLQNIYQKVFTNMNPDLVEKAKQTFRGYTFCGGLGAVPSMMSDVGSINELLHIIHSSIINDENLLETMPIIGTKQNQSDFNITLFGTENEVSKRIFDNFPSDLDVGDTDIVSMEGRTLMMVRDRGHALTIDIDSSDKDNIDVRYFIPKICNLDMIKALPGINPSSITENGASGFFASKEEDISKSIFDFIGNVPTDMDIPEIRKIYEERNKKSEDFESVRISY